MSGATWASFTPVAPSLILYFPKANGNDQQNQERQAIAVPRGNRMAVLTLATRNNFGGDLTVFAPALPKGMTLEADAMASNLDQVPVVFSATATRAPFPSTHCGVGRSAAGAGQLPLDTHMIRSATRFPALTQRFTR